MTIKEIPDYGPWSDFVNHNTTDTFLHSWEWGDFNKKLGYKIWRLGVYDKGGLVAVSLVIKITARRGAFLFIPHGPIFANTSPESIKKITSEIVQFLRSLSCEQRCSFVRIAPALDDNDENRSVFKNLGFNNAPMHMHSELCWVLDISQPEVELLKKMRKTTRYLIKQQEKLNLTIKKSTDSRDIELFNSLYKQTEKRQQFVAFGKTYLEKEFETFVQTNNACFYFAYHDDKLLSAALIIKSGSVGFYHHGASDLSSTKIPASYILQWEIIKDLKKQGVSIYNFWGIAPETQPDHPWRGLTNFKKGFGGFQKNFIRTQDLKLNWKYWINWIIETIRRMRRRY